MYDETARRALRREPPVDQVPGEVLLDQAEAEQVAQPGEDALGARRRSTRLTRIRERLPLQQLGVRARGLDELGLVRVEERGRLGRRQAGCRAQARRDIRDHLLHAAREQLVLLVGAEPPLDRTRGRAEVG